MTWGVSVRYALLHRDPHLFPHIDNSVTVQGQTWAADLM